MAASLSPPVKHIPSSALFVSEPNPSWFGNGANENKPSWTNENWLKSRFHISFAEYRNPKNSNFGCLRVMNDDLVQPERGFGTHPHRDAEIMTYVVEGSLTHQDSLGNKGVVTRGGVQYMSAGSGVEHSEFNHGLEPLRFVQCWVTPGKHGVQPRYGQFDGETSKRTDQMQQIVSNIEEKDLVTPIKVHQDVNMYASELSAVGKTVAFTLQPRRMAYLLCVEGALSVTAAPASSSSSSSSSSGKGEGGGTVLASVRRHDAVEMQGSSHGPIEVTVAAVEVDPKAVSAHFIMFEMAQDARGGRSDLG